MNIIEHPESFKQGVRVLMLKGRNKDGVEDRRTPQLVTRTKEQFDCVLSEFATLARPGERIYASASPRDIRAASRKLKERMLENDYNQDPDQFYLNLENRWISCLMAPTSEADKLWLIDADNDYEISMASNILSVYDRPMAPYSYESKNGVHFLVQPFNRSVLGNEEQRLIQQNPLMLWAY